MPAVANGSPTANRGKNTDGRPGVAAGVALGTICGLAGRDLRSMVSEPMRMTPVL